MAKIHRLPEIIVNQIAAGEVIDRPASIVKEWVENSIDAGAKHVTVKFERGGGSFISVMDDGCGMSREDAALSFERNATSKLTQMKDLDSLQTYGFRGEAIASIASVGYVLMQTNDGTGGTEIVYDSGKKVYEKACSCLRGTYMEVRNLFEKIPARRRFLKSEATEAMHIIRVMRAFILANPDVHFELLRNGKLLFSSPESKDLAKRTEALFGHFSEYTPVEYEDERMQIRGILFEPAADGLASKPECLLFVNGRNVSHPLLIRLLRETYGMVQAREVPIGSFLFFECAGDMVDFNVHPQKKEVRFRNEYAVKRFMEQAVTKALNQKMDRLRVGGVPIEPGEEVPNLGFDRELPFSRSSWGNFSRRENNHFATSNAIQSDLQNDLSRESVDEKSPVEEDPLLRSARFVELTYAQELVNEKKEENELRLWRFIGTFRGGRFGIFESNTGLIFVDISAAQKCILYDQFLHDRKALASQILLMPRIVKVDSDREEVVHAFLPLMNSFGITIEHFGQNVYRISALPEGISESMVEHFLQNEDVNLKKQSLTRDFFVKIFCNYLPFKTLSALEIEEMTVRLLRCQQFLVAPNGQKVLFEIDHCDLGKKFGLQPEYKAYVENEVC